MNVKKIFMALIFSLMIGLNTCAAEDDEILAVADGADPWILAITRDDDGEHYFLILNYQTKQGALVPYERRLYDFYLNESPVIFIMGVADSPRDVDEKLGEWSNNIHLLPVYALFNYSNGQVTLDSYLSSGQGLKPSHYQGRIQSPYHIKLAEVFLTQMPALHRDAESKGVTLP